MIRRPLSAPLAALALAWVVSVGFGMASPAVASPLSGAAATGANQIGAGPSVTEAHGRRWRHHHRRHYRGHHRPVRPYRHRPAFFFGFGNGATVIKFGRPSYRGRFYGYRHHGNRHHHRRHYWQHHGGR